MQILAPGERSLQLHSMKSRTSFKAFCPEVVLAANERPSINDVTARELRALLPRVAEAERARHVFNENENVHNENVFQRALDTNTLVVVSSGSDLPVIDLSRVSAELVDAARHNASRAPR